MKMVSALFILSLSATASFAQKGVEDGSKFGHGEDSIRCLNNISIYTEYVKTSNFKDAYSPWKKVFDEAPLAQVGTYTNGAKILRWFIKNEKDPAKQKAYVQELMGVYDQRLKYLETLNTYVRNPYSKGYIIGLKAHDYYSVGVPDVNTAYDLLQQAINEEKANAEYYLFQEFMDISSKKFKVDPNHKEKFIQDYLLTSSLAEEAIKAETNENMKNALTATKENVDAIFINSGAANCKNLEEIYAPKVAENKTNLEYLKQVMSVMSMLKCTEQQAYFDAAVAAHAIEPTADTAIGLAYMNYKKGNTAKAIEYFEQAINLENDNVKKSDYAYKTAAILFSKKELGRAKTFANKSISLNANNGESYILLAQMYASSPNWSKEAALNKCTYFAVIDKLQKAKSVDSSVASKANSLISKYVGHTPKDSDLFFIGLKKGDRVHIGGWINESTVIR